MLDTLSQLLLGVRWAVFGQGELRLAPPTGVTIAAIFAVVAVAAAVIAYRRAPRRLTTRDRVVLTALRTALVALLMLCLLRPMLVLRAAVPHQNVVAVLLDEKAYDEALKVLAVKPPASFEALFEDARGDVLQAQGKGAEARAAYQAALSKLGAGEEPARELIQLKLDGVGAK